MTALIILLLLMFTPYALFAYRYARFSPWRATYQGITLMAQKVTMASLVAFFIVDTLLPGHWPGRDPLLYILLGLLLVEGWATLAGLVHVQRADHPVTEHQGTGYVNPEDIEGES